MPPKLEISRVWIFLASLGSSNKDRLLATLMMLGIEMHVTINAVQNRSIAFKIIGKRIYRYNNNDAMLVLLL